MIEGLDKGKYTRWAKDLTEDQLRALLWLVGEHFVRRGMRSWMGEYGETGEGLVMDELTAKSAGEKRKARAYNLLLKFYLKPFGLKEAQAGIRNVLR